MVAKNPKLSKAELKDLEKAQKQAQKQALKEQNKGKRVWKLIGTGSALAAGVVTARALDATWQTATGHKPPTKPEHPHLGSREALLWAAISGSAIGVAKTYATRRAAVYWLKSTGRLPPGMPPEGYSELEKSAS